jgi:hypothetical protein
VAQVQEEVVLLRLTKVVKNKDHEDDFLLADNETLYSIEKIAQELLGENVIVEIERAK